MKYIVYTCSQPDTQSVDSSPRMSRLINGTSLLVQRVSGRALLLYPLSYWY
ncbi:hypothetical protein HMPREF9134_00561 [Porphyromonas catoniae F0037]|uniref:Uncharacterized protein n=1 Tax=Porphyromonas catoniae F0037 TaxID=1127696 RepID=L1NG30_9PORP|nr:hypothetical protein HMPREF9134_00561 [Porphyromonas catoniae F0037]